MNLSKAYEWGMAHRHPIFLVGLLLFFILPEILEKMFNITMTFQILIIILIVSSILLIQSSARKRYLSYGLIFLLLIFIAIWRRYKNYPDEEDFAKVGYAMLFIYFSFITFFLFRDLLRSKEVTASMIIGAFAGYFMVGVMFFFIYAFLDTAYPDTINVDMENLSGVEDMFYFSFITLTTIGYGDFSPTSVLGQKIAVLEGLMGQFYIAIVMAILVGKFLSRKNSN